MRRQKRIESEPALSRVISQHALRLSNWMKGYSIRDVINKTDAHTMHIYENNAS